MSSIHKLLMADYKVFRLGMGKYVISKDGLCLCVDHDYVVKNDIDAIFAKAREDMDSIQGFHVPYAHLKSPRG